MCLKNSYFDDLKKTGLLILAGGSNNVEGFYDEGEEPAKEWFEGKKFCSNTITQLQYDNLKFNQPLPSALAIRLLLDYERSFFCLKMFSQPF